MFVSDLARAVQTAELAFGDRGIPIHADARLRECDYGAGNGMPVTQLAAQRPGTSTGPGRAARATGRSWPRWASSWATCAPAGPRTVVLIGHSAIK